jgi:hypothetical protein
MSDGWPGWSKYSVPDLAEILDEDLSVAWSQADAWGETHDLVSRHREVLQQARTTLASVWPPERSPAAAMFFGVLDELIASMGEMQDVAVTNQGAVIGVLASLEQAQATVGELHATWESFVSSPAAEAPNATDVVNGLNQQAQDQMRTTDQAVFEYANRLTVPTPYSPPGRVEPESTPVSAGDQAGQGRTQSGSGSRLPVRPPTIPSLRHPAATPASDVGSVLSGGPRDSQNTGHPGSGGLPTGEQIGRDRPAAAPAIGSWFVTTPGGRALRAGAVIGDPSHGVPKPSQEGQRSLRSGIAGIEDEANGRRVNPVGGLLGGPLSSAMSRERRRRRAMPLDTEWEVRRGVRPILEPGPEPHHDPGPGVIGIDR